MLERKFLWLCVESFYASAISLFRAILSESRIHEKPEEVYVCAGEEVPVAVYRFLQLPVDR